jgi:hypothetical protein
LNINKDAAISIEALKAADNESLTGAGVDMLNWEGVAFVVGALKGEALDFSVKAQQAQVAAFTNAADLLGTATAFSTTIAADGLTVLEIHKPVERYVRPVITVPNATAATPVFCVAIRYGPKYAPVTNAGEFHLSPAEGTA